MSRTDNPVRRVVRCAALVAMLVAHSLGHAAAMAEDIVWTLDEPFPLLSRATFDALDGVQPKLRSARDLLAHLANKWQPGNPILAAPESTQWDEAVGRYKAGYVRRPGDLASATFQWPGGKGLAAFSCRWTVRYAGSPKASSEPKAAACNTSVQLLLPVLQDATVTVVSDTPEARSTSVVAHVVQDVTVALGDSYASGEGNPDVPAVYISRETTTQKKPGADWLFKPDRRLGAPARWWDRECHRSLVSWPVMATLVQALSDDDRHTRYVVLHHACGGAEILDGGFHAQAKAPHMARYSGPLRDGEMAGNNPDLSRIRSSTARSQLNAMYDEVCGAQSRHDRLWEVPGRPAFRAWVEVCDDPIKIDHLVLSMGGNDLGFGKIALGILAPSKPLPGPLRAVGLSVVRRVIGAKSPEAALANVRNYEKVYGSAIRAFIAATGVSSDRSLVVLYPNPVASPGSEGCTLRESKHRVIDDSTKAIRVDPQAVRRRDINLVLGQALPVLSKNLISKGWVVEVTPYERRMFERIYAVIETMQRNALNPGKGLPVILSVPYGEPSHFDGRRMCDPVTDPDQIALPLFLCASDTECDVSREMGGGQWRARPLSQWSHYRPANDKGQRLPQTMVYSMNEAVLGQRSWTSAPAGGEIVEALSGSMHPTAEAHAEAADLVMRNLWSAGVAAKR
jgi:hypothetical protein